MIKWNQVSTFAKKTPVIVTGASVCSFVAGAAVSYFLTEKKVSRQYQQYVEKEIQEAKEYYRRLHKADEYATPQAAAAALNIYRGKDEGDTPIFDELPEAMKDAILKEEERLLAEVVKKQPWSSPPASDGDTTDDTDDLTEAVQNIFDKADEIDNEYELEIASMGMDYPHVISQGEYFQNEDEYEQVTLTYYEGDDILADEKDEVVSDVERVIGLINLKFGYRSGDENLVYVKNNSLKLLFEVARSHGKYSVEVMGFDDPDTKPRRRSRGGDG